MECRGRNRFVVRITTTTTTTTMFQLYIEQGPIESHYLEHCGSTPFFDTK